MKRILFGALILALGATAPALAQHRPHSVAAARSHPAMHARTTVHVRARPIMHARAPHRIVGHFRTSGRHAAHRTLRLSHRSTHHATRRATHSAVHHATHRATGHAIHHVARHAVHHAAQHALRHEVRAAAAKGPFAKVQKTVYAKRRFHAGGYRSPPGWFVHHWVLGERLPRPWFVRDYWLMDWHLYGLWAPVDGLIWVRVGNDALLIDPDSGEIIGIEYDVFW